MKHLRKIVTVLVVLGMLIVGVFFALQNKAQVPLDMLVYTFGPQSLALWILSAFAFGGLMGLLVSSFILIRTRASLGVCRRQLEKVRAEISTLRAANPVADAP
ncbi:MAG: LapA family protein [Halioglobus sp.]